MTLFLCIFLFLSFICSTANAGDYYTAAVVEYNPNTNYDPNITKDQAQAVMFSNLKEYELLISEAKKQDAQIIVFPEYGLFGADFETRDSIYPFLEEIPEPNSGSICKNYTFITSPVVQKLSCLAVSYNIVIVVNIGAYVPCTAGVGGCPIDGRWQYNTDVVFSEEGDILTKYYKSHLYGEMEYNQPLVPDPKIFTTSFGVTFGILICFDIMFPYPQLYYEQANITNLVYSTWWVNTPPYFSANQVQLAWSTVTKSNLLASGIGMNMYTSGSGIFSAGDPLEFYFNPTWNPAQKLLIHTLPKNPQSDKYNTEAKVEGGKKLHDDVETRRRAIQDIAGANVSVFLASKGAAGSLSVSEGNLTCSVSYQISDSASSEDYYGLAVLNGDYNGLFYGQICAVLLCPSNTTCTGEIMDASTVFFAFQSGGQFQC